MAQALTNIKILDLSRGIAGAYCTRILAGFGAEVIKIEKPDRGSVTRNLRPFKDDIPGIENSGLNLYLNVRKKSVTLNLKSDTGVKIIQAMAQDADAIIEDFTPGKMARLGIGFRSLQKINPRLVMTSITAFGQTGPYKNYKMNHLTAWGMSGARFNDGAPGVRPVQIGGWLTHYITGLFANVGTCTALYDRNTKGKGRHVDVSMWESNLLITCYPTTIYSYRGLVHNAVSKERMGIFKCKDGYIGLNLYGRLNFELLCNFLGMPEMAADPRFSTPAALWVHFEEARTIITRKIKDRMTMELFQSGAEWRIPIGLVPDTKEILESPQHLARGFFETVDHPIMGKVNMPGAPFKMSATSWRTSIPAPLLGEHNREIYGDWLKYSSADLVKLRERGVI
jgi:CoA:oxalate CoA-transferase